MKKVKHRKTILIISGVILVIALCIGGIYMQIENHQREENLEMIKIAKDHKKEMDEQILCGDKGHHIKVITYKWDTMEHNPMGGIMVEGYVNHDKDLDFELILEKNNGKITCRLMESAPEIAQWKGF